MRIGNIREKFTEEFDSELSEAPSEDWREQLWVAFGPRDGQKKADGQVELASRWAEEEATFHGRLGEELHKTQDRLRKNANVNMEAVNELEELEEGIKTSWKLLTPYGRIAIISFHSLEDRLVKNFFKEKVINKQAQLINKKVIVPSIEEIKNNPRSRSAKLRILEKIK